MSKFKYTLTDTGKKKCLTNEFYLQNTPGYRGYAEKILRALHQSERPLTLAEISELTKIRSCDVTGTMNYYIYSGYIKRLLI
jgi:hypothetical protein